MNSEDINTTIETIGEAKIPSPLKNKAQGGITSHFVSDNDRILIDVSRDKIAQYCKQDRPLPSFDQAGPREKIYFDPSKLKCAIVTCGGLCPGLNDIIRSVVLELYHCSALR